MVYKYYQSNIFYFRNSERKTFDTRAKLTGFRDLNIELDEIYKMSVNAEKVINNTIDTKVSKHLELRFFWAFSTKYRL